MIYRQTKDSFALIRDGLSKILIAVALIVAATGCSQMSNNNIEGWKAWVAYAVNENAIQEHCSRPDAVPQHLSDSNRVAVYDWLFVYFKSEILKDESSLYKTLFYNCSDELYAYYDKKISGEVVRGSMYDYAKQILMDYWSENRRQIVVSDNEKQESKYLTYVGDGEYELFDRLYEVDWIFNNEEYLDALTSAFISYCGSYECIVEYAASCTKVIQRKLVSRQSGMFIHNVVYQVMLDGTATYVQCEVVDTEDESQIQVIDASNSLSDFIE